MDAIRARPTLPWVALVAVAAVTGFVGWLLTDAGGADAAYRTLQLFLLEFPDDLDEINGWLQFGRFAAAGATGIAIISVAAQYLRDRFARVRVRRLSGHTIVVGCGRTGTTILKSLKDHDPDKVLLSLDRSLEALEEASHLGVHTVHGDARDSDVLRRARPARARRVIVAVDDWGIATQIAETATSLVGPSTTVLTHLDDLSLSHAVRLRFLRHDVALADVFNLHENAARALLRRYDDRLAGDDRGPERITVVGGQRVAEAVLLQAVRSWLGSLRDIPLDLQLAGPDASKVLADVIARWPEFDEVLSTCEVIDRSAMDYASRADVGPSDLVIVDLPDGDHAVAVGAALRERSGEADIEVLAATPPEGHGLPGVSIRSLSELAWSPHILEVDSLWQLAYSLHEIYRQGSLAGTSPHAEPWDELSDTIQEDNRLAVSFMLQRLSVEQFRIRRARAAYLRCGPAELAEVIEPVRRERLARAEHHRWLADRSASAEPPRRHTSDWEELAQEAKEETLATVMTWPRLLVRLGYEIEDVLEVADPDHLLAAPSRYQRHREVRARPAEHQRAWTTEEGQQLNAERGDWIVEDGDRCWSVRDAAFRSTYEHIEGDRFRSDAIVEAVQLPKPYRVHTPEGDLIAAPEDWLLRNEVGDVWSMSDAEFTERYEPV